eukprot:7597369-Pyramimonas_sp.AAC.1
MPDFSPAQVGPFMLGPHWGSQSQQTVPRGELQCLRTAIEFSSGVLVYVADNDEVCRGWWQRLFVRPEGHNADLW